MTTVAGVPAESILHTDGVYTWHSIPTPLGERYELEWPTVPCDDCRGVVVQTGPYYDAYIEVRFGTGSTTQWAQMQFQTAGAARAWVQNHMVACPGTTAPGP
jgi:hypothetical protein